MKSIIVAILSLSLLLSPKDKPKLNVNPDYFGFYYRADEMKTKEWTLKPMDKPDRIAFYHNSDTDFVFYVIMKDSTHFSSKGEFMQQSPGQQTRYWSGKGEFLPGGQMRLAVRNSDAALKLTMDMEGQEKIIYAKK